MNTGDTVQILQTDHAILRKGEEPTPSPHWIYATVYEVTKDGKAATVEVNHPGNFQHGSRMLVARKNIRTHEDLQALHDKHPHRAVKTPSYDNPEHKELINIRAALERSAPPKEEPA